MFVMSVERSIADWSGDSIRSPLKTHAPKTSNLEESEHTFALDGDDCQSKGSYETARDKRVAKMRKMFRPVEEAAESLYLLSLFLFPLVCFFDCQVLLF